VQHQINHRTIIHISGSTVRVYIPCVQQGGSNIRVYISLFNKVVQPSGFTSPAINTVFQPAGITSPAIKHTVESGTGHGPFAQLCTSKWTNQIG
jgi:hypothetical protein